MDIIDDATTFQTHSYYQNEESKQEESQSKTLARAPIELRSQRYGRNLGAVGRPNHGLSASNTEEALRPRYTGDH